MKLIEHIEFVSRWENLKHANPHLDFATMCLMAESVGFDIEPLGDFWRTEYRDRCEVRPGIFKRAPKDINNHCDYLHKYSFSHDEMLGLAWCSYRFDGGEADRRVLDEGICLGLYLSGLSPNKSGLWIDNYLDSEWFQFILRGYMRGYVKMAAGRNITQLEKNSIKNNLLFTKGSMHLTDFKLLWLKQLNPAWMDDTPKLVRQRLGTDYRGRYGDNPIYKELWVLRDAKSI